MATLLNRTDLLACLDRFDASQIDKFADVLGYAVFEMPIATHVVIQLDSIVHAQSIQGVTLTITPEPINTETVFLHAVSHRRFKDEEVITEQPEWFQKAEPYQDNEADLKAPINQKPPTQPPLMAWRRLWPLLKLALGANTLDHKPDLPRIVDHLAKGEPLRRLPKAKRKGWASQAQLILDFDPSLLPFWADFNSLHEQLAGLRGQAGLKVLAFRDGDPSGVCWQHTDQGWRTIAHYPLPEAGTPILILSDLGCNDTSDQRRWRWRRFGTQLAHTACRPVALMPSPPRWWDAELTQLFTTVYWDRAVRPPQSLSKNAAYPTNAKTERDLAPAETLLSLLGAAVRIEPALLRATRYLLPASVMDVGAEYAAWNHSALQTTLLAAYFQPSQAAYYRERLRDDSSFSTELKHQVSALLSYHHAHLSPVIAYEEQLASAELLGETIPENAKQFTQRLAKTIADKDGDICANASDWLNRVLLRQAEQGPLLQNEYFNTALVVANKKGLLSQLPETIRFEQYAWLLADKPPVDCQIVQCGQQLHFVPTTNGSRIASFRHSSAFLQIETADGQRHWHTMDQPLSLTPNQTMLIRSDREELGLAWLTLPSWAEVIGQDSYGLYADLNLKGISQRFRWIPPGVFMMGSPESELGRSIDETQHEVTLTQGYWLADTTCTQAFWQVVMSQNTFRFKDDPNNPVDGVSWHDCQQFVRSLNKKSPGLNARLPSEAEWEYACRAGTTTPFSFGDNITLEKVNYDGQYPYADGSKGEDRGKTVPVKSLPANPWGLYEMHGNVWEWCEDRFGAFGADPEIDPSGSKQIAHRVLRGGSSANSGKNVRSSRRFKYAPGQRHYDVGFRLALGRSGVSSRADEGGGQWPDGQPERSGGGQAS